MKAMREDPKMGVWAASAGNHSLGLSYHGHRLGIPVNIVMPLNAAINKVDACMKLKANVLLRVSIGGYALY